MICRDRWTCELFSLAASSSTTQGSGAQPISASLLRPSMPTSHPAQDAALRAEIGCAEAPPSVANPDDSSSLLTPPPPLAHTPLLAGRCPTRGEERGAAGGGQAPRQVSPAVPDVLSHAAWGKGGKDLRQASSAALCTVVGRHPNRCRRLVRARPHNPITHNPFTHNPFTHKPFQTPPFHKQLFHTQPLSHTPQRSCDPRYYDAVMMRNEFDVLKAKAS